MDRPCVGLPTSTARGTETRCLQPRLHPSYPADAASRQRLGGPGGRRTRPGRRREAARRHYGGADRHSSPDRQHLAMGCRPRGHTLGPPSGKAVELRRSGVPQSHTRGTPSDARDPADDAQATARAADPEIPRAHRHRRGGRRNARAGSRRPARSRQGHVHRPGHRGAAPADRPLL